MLAPYPLPRTLALALLLTACGGDDAANLTEGAVTGSSAVTDPTDPTAPTDPTGVMDETTGDVTDDPCACDMPVVHDGLLRVEDLATYQDACLVEVTEGIEIDQLEDPALLGALSHLRRAGWVSIDRSPGLIDLSTLSCLRETRSINLRSNPNLTDISALDQVEVVETLSLHNIPITTLPSFAPSYKGIRSLFLVDLPELRDLDPIFGWAGLHSEELFNGSFSASIVDVPKLESIAGLASPIADAIASSSPLSSQQTELRLELADLPALDSLAGLETFTRGQLELRNLPEIEHLSPLSNLEQARELRISGLPALTSLEGLGALKSAERLILGGCEEGDVMTSLESLAGVDLMTKVSSHLWIVGAPALANLSAPSLINVEAFSFVDTPGLSDVEVAAFSEQVGASYECAGDRVECACIYEIPKSVTSGCPSSWGGGSAVVGASTVGPLNGVTAFFGWIGSGYTDSELVLVILDSAADVESAKAGRLSSEVLGTPKAILWAERSYLWWLGASPSPVKLFNSAGESASATVELDVQGRLGAWGSPSLVDPPRLYGEIKSSDPDADVVLDGPFDAVFCEDFVRLLSD